WRRKARCRATCDFDARFRSEERDVGAREHDDRSQREKASPEAHGACAAPHPIEAATVWRTGLSANAEGRNPGAGTSERAYVGEHQRRVLDVSEQQLSIEARGSFGPADVSEGRRPRDER